MLHEVAGIGENRNPNLQGLVWTLLKSISAGRTTGVQTINHFSLSLLGSIPALNYTHLTFLQVAGSYTFKRAGSGPAS